MILIVESGATKGDWRLITENGEERVCLLADGTNVSTMPLEAVHRIIRETGSRISEMAGEVVSAVYFYTAGVITEQIEAGLHAVLSSVFKDSEIEIQSDLIAAARAVCGHKPGIAAILGTGGNSCQYDGEKISKRVYSSGFILGDEGSAATLGRLFLSDFLKGLVPEHISRDFSSRYDSSYAAIVENVYRNSGSPSGYLGSFAPFIMEYYSDPYIKSLVDDNFRAFFTRAIKQYDYKDLPVGIVGGFGYALREVVLAVAAEEGVPVSSIIRRPIDGLIKYHTEKA